jgi:hypothetical protein
MGHLGYPCHLSPGLKLRGRLLCLDRGAVPALTAKMFPLVSPHLLALAVCLTGERNRHASS